MTRDEVIEIINQCNEHVSYKYEHPEEYREAMILARFDVRAVSKLIRITKSELSEEEKKNEILEIVREARFIAKED